MSGNAAAAVPFQSTLSVRRATQILTQLHTEIRISIHALRKESDESGREAAELVRISIHALRKESDAAPPSFPTPTPYFNPRSP